MSGHVPLDARRHASVRLRAGLDATTLRYARLGLSEITTACADYVICLAKEAATGRFNLIALLSLERPNNLFWLGGRWQATYVPAAALTAPFLLDDRSDHGLAIDERSTLLGTDGAPLFTVDGRPTELVAAARSRLAALQADVAQGQAMVDRFAALQLIRPLRVRLTGADEPHEIDGLYSLGSHALASLPDHAVLDLYRSGYLAAASLIAASLQQFERLRQLDAASAGTVCDGLEAEVVEA